MTAPRWLIICLLLLQSMIWQPLRAAESEEQPEPPPANTESEEEEDPLLTEAAEAEDAPRQASSDDTFTPSVQISEDLSVSFPVDI